MHKRVIAIIGLAGIAALTVPVMTGSANASNNYLTYRTWGTSGAQVTYGRDGSSYTGTVPMNIKRTLSSAVSYYAISAQLQGSGSVTVEIKVHGHVMSKGTASGGYNIASAEICQSFAGAWEDCN
jgi:hypothetical protein